MRHTWRLVAVASVGLLAASATRVAIAGAGSPQAAGAIRGRVDVQRPAAPPERRPDPAGMGMAPPRGQENRRQAIVYLETAPQPAFDDRPLPRARLDQRDESFVPHVLAIQVGTVVDFPNDDRVYHNVFSLSKTRPFDLGRYARGQSKWVRFDTPGVVRVFCDIHAHMSAYIIIFSHRFFAVTDDQGRYRIDRVPPGTYTLVVWYEGDIRESRQVTVTAEPAGAEVDFVIK